MFRNIREFLPLYFVSRLSNEESLSICSDPGTTWINRDFTVGASFALYLDGQQQELQFCEAQPTTKSCVIFDVSQLCKLTKSLKIFCFYTIHLWT